MSCNLQSWNLESCKSVSHLQVGSLQRQVLELNVFPDITLRAGPMLQSVSGSHVDINMHWSCISATVRNMHTCRHVEHVRLCYHAYHTCSKSEWFPAIQLTHFMPTFYWFITRASFWICLTTGSTELNRTKLKWQVILTHCLISCESSTRSTWSSIKVQVIKVILNIFRLDCHEL